MSRKALHTEGESMKPDLNGPWSCDKGQLRDKDGNSLASFPYTIGGEEDLHNGELCALLPTLIDTLAALVDRCDHAPILVGNEGMRGPLLAEAKAMLLRVGIETYRPAPGATYQKWLVYRGVPMVIVADAKDREAISNACGLLIQANRKARPCTQ